jgi:hypothetical protein
MLTTDCVLDSHDLHHPTLEKTSRSLVLFYTMSTVSFAGLESTCFSWASIGKNDSWLCLGLMDLFDIYGWSYQLIKTIWTLVDVYKKKSGNDYEQPIPSYTWTNLSDLIVCWLCNGWSVWSDLAILSKMGCIMYIYNTYRFTYCILLVYDIPCIYLPCLTC